jgi:hypothetical protein
MTLLALIEHRARRYRSTIATLAGGVLALQLTLMFAGLPIAERFKISKPLAEAIRARTDESVPVAEHDYGEPSLVFYLRGRVIESLEDNCAVRRWAHKPYPGVLVISRQALARIEKESGPLGLEPLGNASGFNYSKGRWIDLLALARGLPGVTPLR